MGREVGGSIGVGGIPLVRHEANQPIRPDVQLAKSLADLIGVALVGDTNFCTFCSLSPAPSRNIAALSSRRLARKVKAKGRGSLEIPEPADGVLRQGLFSLSLILRHHCLEGPPLLVVFANTGLGVNDLRAPGPERDVRVLVPTARIAAVQNQRRAQPGNGGGSE